MKADVRTIRSTIRGVADAWRLQYGSDKRDIYNKLRALNVETATADDVAAIIGNRSWVRLECDGCKRDVDRLVVVGAAPDYESATADLCRDCLLDAMRAMESDA